MILEPGTFVFGLIFALLMTSAIVALLLNAMPGWSGNGDSAQQYRLARSRQLLHRSDLPPAGDESDMLDWHRSI